MGAVGAFTVPICRKEAALGHREDETTLRQSTRRLEETITQVAGSLVDRELPTNKDQWNQKAQKNAEEATADFIEQEVGTVDALRTCEDHLNADS